MAILEKNLLKIRIKSYWRNTVFFSHCAFSTELHQRIFTMGLIIWYSWWFSFMSYRPYNICWNLCNLWRFRLHFHYNKIHTESNQNTYRTGLWFSRETCWIDPISNCFWRIYLSDVFNCFKTIWSISVFILGEKCFWIGLKVIWCNEGTAWVIITIYFINYCIDYFSSDL